MGGGLEGQEKCEPEISNECVDETVVASASTPSDLIIILLVTREDIQRNGEDSFQVLGHPETAGHKAVSGPHIKVLFILF